MCVYIAYTHMSVDCPFTYVYVCWRTKQMLYLLWILTAPTPLLQSIVFIFVATLINAFSPSPLTWTELEAIVCRNPWKISWHKRKRSSTLVLISYGESWLPWLHNENNSELSIERPEYQQSHPHDSSGSSWNRGLDTPRSAVYVVGDWDCTSRKLSDPQQALNRKSFGGWSTGPGVIIIGSGRFNDDWRDFRQYLEKIHCKRIVAALPIARDFQGKVSVIGGGSSVGIEHCLVSHQIIGAKDIHATKAQPMAYFQGIDKAVTIDIGLSFAWKCMWKTRMLQKPK